MAISSAQYAIGNVTPTQIVAPDSLAENIYFHSSTGTIFIGGSNVTTSTGYQLDNGDKLTLQGHEEGLWAISSTGNPALSVLVITK